jgi:hypothetical protein
MAKQNTKNSIIERVVVPGEEANNQAITGLIELESTLQPRNFTYNTRPKTGFIIELKDLKIIAASVLKDPDKYRTMEIYDHKTDGYHLLSPKDLREIIRTKKHIIDPRMKKSLKQMKENLITNTGSA